MPQVWNKQSSENPSCSALLCLFRNQQQCSVLMGLYFTDLLNACRARQGDKNLESLTQNQLLVGLNKCRNSCTFCGAVLTDKGLFILIRFYSTCFQNHWRWSYWDVWWATCFPQPELRVSLVRSALMPIFLIPQGSSTGALAPQPGVKVGNSGRMPTQIFDNTSSRCSFNPRPGAGFYKSQEMLSPLKSSIPAALPHITIIIIVIIAH